MDQPTNFLDRKSGSQLLKERKINRRWKENTFFFSVKNSPCPFEFSTRHFVLQMLDFSPKLKDIFPFELDLFSYKKCRASVSLNFEFEKLLNLNVEIFFQDRKLRERKQREEILKHFWRLLPVAVSNTLNCF